MAFSQKHPMISEGPLCKWTNLVHGWQYRWFVLDPNKGVLSYYTSKEKINRGERRGCVKLKSAQIGIDNEDDSTFTITVDHKTFHFQAQNADECQRWLDVLQEVRDRHTHTNTFIQTHNRYLQQQDHTLADFERRIVEADVYLRLLIDQQASLSLHLKDISNPHKSDDILVNLNGIIENIKQTIACLQKAKENAVQSLPPPRLCSTDAPPSGSKANTHDSASMKEPRGKRNRTPPILAINGGGGNNAASSSNDLTVPMVSYSSDEEVTWADEDNGAGGEDIFFDTVENLPSRHSLHVGGANIRGSTSTNSLVFPPHEGSQSSDYDPLYDEITEDDVGNLQAHGSVIMHLVSQVRIGMDLTKITLPTFILERRSTLEMYADFLAHADLWARITDYESPRDRFVAALRWYLSAFHAGRRSPVAKKPYNPILGEIFRCYWDLDDTHRKTSITGSTCSGSTLPNLDSAGHQKPVPWAPDNAVCFVAEQVSHHPPISAFYAEHVARGIVCEGSLWTKSKFLGLSIGVEMVGSATLTILGLGEHYIVTFPGGFGRNILSVPWVELGGRCSVRCPETGYSATVEFKTKPFYGGKKDQIRAEAFAPGDEGKKPFLVVEGEWNNRMIAKWPDGKQELFFDAKTAQMCQKRVRPRFEQESFESRKLWEDVTMNLKRGNMESATEAKSALEQKQREEAKQRREQNVEWSPRFFHSASRQWSYRWPMTSSNNNAISITPPKNVRVEPDTSSVISLPITDCEDMS